MTSLWKNRDINEVPICAWWVLYPSPEVMLFYLRSLEILETAG